ncbi:MAG: CU044_2847 family protein, partial [Chloroflexota bacterium]
SDVSTDVAKEAYTQMLNTIKACASGVVDTLQEAEVQPSNASIDFAIKVDAKAGAMIAKSMGDAHFKVAFSWRQPEPEKEDANEDKDGDKE